MWGQPVGGAVGTLTRVLTPYCFSTFSRSCLKQASSRSWNGRSASVTFSPWMRTPSARYGICKHTRLQHLFWDTHPPACIRRQRPPGGGRETQQDRRTARGTHFGDRVNTTDGCQVGYQGDGDRMRIVRVKREGQAG